MAIIPGIGIRLYASEQTNLSNVQDKWCWYRLCTSDMGARASSVPLILLCHVGYQALYKNVLDFRYVALFRN